MTNLPTYAKAIKAEALAFAREMIAGFARGSNPWSPDPPLSADASQAFFRHMVRTALQFTPTRMQIIAAAKAGDLDATRCCVCCYWSTRQSAPTCRPI
jgi:hypothetical protein